MKNTFYIAILLLISTPVMAEIYKYHDAAGRLYFTDQKRDETFKLIAVYNADKTKIHDVQDVYTPESYDNNVRQFLPHIEHAAKQHNLDPKLLRAIVDTESAFDPKAYSKAGAVGLMQLMPKTANGLGVNDSWNPKENIQGGALLLRQLLDKFNQNIQLSLAAYNAGENAVIRAGNAIPNFPETQRYVQKVISRYTEL